MNKLRTDFNGGDPLVLDDFRFEQKAIRDSFYALMSAFGISPVSSFVISGCNIVGPVVLPGWISLNGEILKFNGSAIPVVTIGFVACWDLNVTYDPAGAHAMQDGTTAQQYEVRTAQLVVVSTSTGAAMMKFDGTTLQTKLVRMVSQDNSDADLATYILSVMSATPIPATVGGGGAVYQSGFAQVAAGKPLRYWKDLTQDIVHIQGHFKCTTTAALAVPVFFLPPALRPVVDDIVPFTAWDIINDAPLYLYVDKSDGGLYVKGPTNPRVYGVGHISFKIN